jgi:hypothetical protein
LQKEFQPLFKEEKAATSTTSVSEPSQRNPPPYDNFI